MTQHGGAATHYGVLYQALGTIDAGFTICSTGKAEDPDTITLTVEPSGGGGDTIASQSGLRRVMQFKARGDYRTWSLNEIINDALRDLYQAVSSEPDTSSEYLLITEGREGQIENARVFFRELDRDVIPDDPLGVLDDVALIPYFPSETPLTKRQFFDHVTRRLYRSPEDTSPSASEYRRVWSLLSRFDIRQEKFDELAESVEHRLLGHVDAPEDVAGKAREIFGILLQLAAKGHQSFTLRSLLSKAGLPSMSLADLPAARGVAADRLVTLFKRRGHDPAAVVRRSVSITAPDSIFCLAGGSGSGKTILAEQIALDCVSSDIVVFVSGRMRIADALNVAANEVWQRLLEHGRPTDWESLMNHGKLVGMSASERWVTVFLDITAGVAEAEELLRLEWPAWKVRLLFTTDEAAGKMIREDAQLTARCKVQLLDRLSVSETYELLRKRGQTMAHVPEDVADLLRWPILADIYCRLKREADWKPSDEYQLFDAFWNNAQYGSDGRRHVQDLGILLRLAETLLDPDAPHTWPQDVLHAMNVSEEAQQRLIEHGWLRELESTAVEFAHERFMNWAVANAMYEKAVRGQWTAAHLTSSLNELYGTARESGKLFLGYVPMDVLWLLVHRKASEELIVSVSKTLGDSDSYDRRFYEDMIPTIGPQIVPALHRIMREESREWHSRHEIAEGIRQISTRYVIEGPVVVALLEDDIEEIHDVGMAVARSWPQAAAIDVLWRLKRQASSLQEADTHSFWRTDRALRALMAAVRQNPEWIRRAVHTAESSEELQTLSWFVSMLGDERGAALWRELKPVFLNACGAKGARGALQCIDRYSDTGEVETLVGWIAAGDNFVPAEALAALAALDGARAFAFVENEPLDQVETLSAFWLPPLFLHDNERTHAAIRKRFEEFAISAATLHWHFRGDDQIDAALIGSLIARLTPMIADHLKGEKRDRPPVPIEHLLEILGAVNSCAGLARLRSEESSEFADSLVALAARYTPHDSSTLDRWFVRAIQQVLLRIGGEPLSRFVLLQLRNPGDSPRADIRSAVCAPSEQAVRLLIALVEQAKEDDDRNGTRSMDALDALASLGKRETVVRLIEKHPKLPYVSNDLFNLLIDIDPVGDEQLENLLNGDTSDITARRRRLWLLGFSGRADVIPRLVEELESESNDDVRTSFFAALRRLTNATTSVDTVLKIGFSNEPEEVATLLLRIGTDEALNTLAALLEREATTLSDDLVERAARLVTEHQRLELAPAVWRFVKTRPRRFFISTELLYDAVGHLEDGAVLDFLHKEAFAPRAKASAGAIRGLSHQRPEVAFEAAQAALASLEANREVYPDLLMDIDPARAPGVLCNQLLRERTHRVRLYICRALRRAQSDPALQQRVTDMIASSDAYERASGCQVAGWFEDFQDEALRALALREADSMVRAFALAAVLMHEHHRRVAELLAEFAKTTGSYSWALLQAILDTGNPLLLTHSDDLLWLRAALASRSRGMIRYASERLKKALEDLARNTDDAFEPHYR